MRILGLTLMSLAVLMYGVIPLFADFRKTHATNPKWPAHARFHVVTQVLTTSAVGAIALWLLWSPGIERNIGVCIAAILSFAVIGSFFASAGFRSAYGGALNDIEGGASRQRTIDANSAVFGAAAALLIAGRVVLL
jgi:hypothetical protein